MPDRDDAEALAGARRDARQGKAPSTQAGEFVHEEIEHVREGKHGARSTKQAIAIGLSKARRAGVKLRPPAKGKAPARTRRQAAKDVAKGRRGARKTSVRRSRASLRRLKREPTSTVSSRALSRHAKASARKRGPAARKAAAQKAARTRARRR